MVFRIHLISIYITLFLFTICIVNASQTEDWLKSKLPRLGFSWDNCGPATDALKIKTLTVSPDPIHVPGNLTIGLTAVLSSALPTDVHVVVVMEKKVGGFFVKVPCIDNFGSCTYGNICQDWAEACPKYFSKYGIPCTCPIPANTYSVPDAIIQIKGKLPSIGEGTYRITGDLGSSAGHIGCIRLQIDLKG